MKALANMLLALSVLGPTTDGFAAALVEDVAYQEQAQAIQITFACPVRYLEHPEQSPGKEFIVRLLELSACANTSTLEPPELSSAGESLLGMQFMREGGELIMQLSFIERGRYLVSQGSDANRIWITSRLPSVAKPATKQQPLATSEDSMERLASAREQLLDGAYESAISTYTGLLDDGDPGVHPEALEYLALAYQLSGRPGLARTRYEEWLRRFTNAADRQRVQQRLDALSTTPSTLSVAQPGANTPKRWDLFGAIGQDIWSFSAQSQLADFDTQQADKTIAVTYADLGAHYKSASHHVRVHTSIGYQHALASDSERDQDEPFARRAFIDYQNKDADYGLRIGRQVYYGDGILGAFDGIRGGWQYRDDIRVNLSAGLPVDNPRYAADTDRQFVGASIDFEQLVADIDANFYAHLQQTSGVWDRQALGTQWRVNRNTWHALSRLDYDVSYNVLNTALLEFGWRISDWLEGHARVNFYTSPYIGTSNALIGQSVTSIDDLLAFYTDSQLRTIARNRTTDVQQFALGWGARLSPRWTAKLDTSYAKLERSLTSADVAAEPAATQIETIAKLIGSSILRSEDSLAFSYRLFSDLRADSHTATIDWRVRLADHLRLNPRLSVTHRVSDMQGDQMILAPGMRLTYLWRRAYQLHLEVNGRWSDRELPMYDPFQLGLDEMTEENQELFVHLQWRVEF